MALMDFVRDSVFYRPDAFPAIQPTASKHSKKLIVQTAVLL